MKQVYKERLLRLARLLERDARNEKGVIFNMGSWGRVPDVNIHAPAQCGTKACAMGLAAISSEFAKDGLSYALRDYKEHYCDPNGRGFVGAPFDFYWQGAKLHGFDAGCRLFGLTRNQSQKFFSPTTRGASGGATAELSLARRIRRFVTAQS